MGFRCSSEIRDGHCPHPEDVPEKLRGLSQEAIVALRTLDVCVGPETRSTTHAGKPNGYRKKVQIIRFAWSDLSPRKKIKRLGDVDMKRKAKEAAQSFLRTESRSG